MRAKQTDPQLKLRLPVDLRDEIMIAAAANNRSMNAEIIARISGSNESLRDRFAMAASKPFTITVRLTEAQRERLDAASAIGPYSISLTDIIARGIELAAIELEAMEAARKGGAE